MEFELWHIWLLIAFICIIMEIFIPSFILFNFGIGAFAGSLAAGLQLSLEWQIVSFSAGTLLSFFLIRPIMKKFAYRRSNPVLTNVEAMIGQVAKVKETINNFENTGSVFFEGNYWPARSEKNEIIVSGKNVEIIRINSITLIVKLI